MTPTFDALYAMVRTPKHAFHNAGYQSGKARQRRYERRKAKAYIKRQDWLEEREQDRRR